MRRVENIAIQTYTYVAHTHPEAKLLPEDPVGEARARSLKGFFASAVHQHRQRRMDRPERAEPLGADRSTWPPTIW